MSENKYPLIYGAMSNVMMDIGSIGKNQKNNHQGFNFRGIDDVYNHLQFILAKHKVTSLPTKIIELDRQQVKTSNNKATNRICATIEYTFMAEDGSFIKTEVLSEAMDTGDKASPKVMSIAHKYALIQAFSIPVQDVAEPDRDSYIIEQQEKSDEIIFIDPKKADDIEKRIDDYGVNRTGFISWLVKEKIARSIVKIPEKHYDKVSEMLNTRAPKES